MRGIVVLFLVVGILLAVFSVALSADTLKRIKPPRPYGLRLRKHMFVPEQKWFRSYTPTRSGVLTTEANKKYTPIKLVERKESVSGWNVAQASWYGPGFYGKHTASGAVLREGSRNFAHRTMRFGTEVEFMYEGRSVVAVCNDRGPFVAGRVFDLGPGTAKALGFDGVHRVYWRYVRR